MQTVWQYWKGLLLGEQRLMSIVRVLFKLCPPYGRLSYHFCDLLYLMSGLGSSVGIATDYGLDDPGSNPGGDEIFRLSRPALGPT